MLCRCLLARCPYFNVASGSRLGFFFTNQHAVFRNVACWFLQTSSMLLCCNRRIWVRRVVLTTCCNHVCAVHVRGSFVEQKLKARISHYGTVAWQSCGAATFFSHS